MLIINGTVLTFGDDKRVWPYGAVYYEGDTIVEVGRTADLLSKYPQAEKLDAAGKIVMPGMICAHTHFYGAFARGMAIPGNPPENFMQILERLWWKIDRALTLADSKYSALVGLVDAIRHGTTTLIYNVPTRGLLGFRAEFIMITKGEGILHHSFSRYERFKGKISKRQNGVLISGNNDKTASYALENLQQRGNLFLGPGVPVYEGMMVFRSTKQALDSNPQPISGFF